MKSFTNTFLSKARRDLNKLSQIADENTLRVQPTSKPTSLSICAKVIRPSRLEHSSQSTPFAPHPSPIEANHPLSVSKLISNRDLSEPQNFRVPSIFNSSQRCPQQVTNPYPCLQSVFKAIDFPLSKDLDDSLTNPSRRTLIPFHGDRFQLETTDRPWMI